MNAILEVVLALLAAGGLLALSWLLFGRLLAPVGAGGAPVCAVVPVAGSGEGLEQTVSGLLWLRGGGLARFTIVVADGGLNPEGLAIAEALLRREPELRFCPLSQVEPYLKETTENGCC